MLYLSSVLTALDVLRGTPFAWIPLINVIVAVLSFAIGVGVGWHLSEDVELVTRERLQRTIALLVTTVWTISVLSDILLVNYSTPLVLYGIMGAVAGYLFSDDGLTINIGKD